MDLWFMFKWSIRYIGISISQYHKIFNLALIIINGTSWTFFTITILLKTFLITHGVYTWMLLILVYHVYIHQYNKLGIKNIKQCETILTIFKRYEKVINGPVRFFNFLLKFFFFVSWRKVITTLNWGTHFFDHSYYYKHD